MVKQTINDPEVDKTKDVNVEGESCERIRMEHRQSLDERSSS